MTEQTKPVLIGSSALRVYGYPTDENTDIDLIVTKEKAQGLALECDKKVSTLCFFGKNDPTVFDLNVADIASDNPDSTTKIYVMCNEYFEELGCCEIEIPIIGSVIIAPLEILYAIKKSHIHRIIPVASSIRENIRVWKKQVYMYLWMRDQIGYKWVDKVMYDNSNGRYGPPRETPIEK